MKVSLVVLLNINQTPIESSPQLQLLIITHDELSISI